MLERDAASEWLSVAIDLSIDEAGNRTRKLAGPAGAAQSAMNETRDTKGEP